MKTIAKVSCESGTLVEQFELQNAGSLLDWARFSTILLMIDENDEKMYAVYKKRNATTEICVAEFIPEPKMNLGVSYTINLKDKGLKGCVGKIFIYGGRVFIGETYKNETIEHEFNLLTNKWEATEKIILSGASHIQCCTYLPKEQAFLANYCEKHIGYFSA